MPITVTAPAGCLTPTGEREILPRLTATLLDAAGATGNPFLSSIVGGTVNILDRVAESLTSDGHRREDIWINILHARDGAWGLGRRAHSNDALLAAAGAVTADDTGQH